MITLELTKQDIRKFINDPQFFSKFNIKYHEALFIRYLNESNNITLEQFDMLTKKYHNYNGIMFDKLSSFSNYLDNLKFTQESIFEVLIASRAYYDGNYSSISYGVNAVEELYTKLQQYITLKNNKLAKYYGEVINNYEIAGLMRNGFIEFPDEQALHELEEYKRLYGKEPVEIISDHVKNLKKVQTFFGCIYTSKNTTEEL